MTNVHFQWTGSCEAIGKNCTEDEAGCETIRELEANKDYRCNVDSKILTLVRY